MATQVWTQFFVQTCDSSVDMYLCTIVRDATHVQGRDHERVQDVCNKCKTELLSSLSTRGEQHAQFIRSIKDHLLQQLDQNQPLDDATRDRLLIELNCLTKSNTSVTDITQALINDMNDGFNVMCNICPIRDQVLDDQPCAAAPLQQHQRFDWQPEGAML